MRLLTHGTLQGAGVEKAEDCVIPILCAYTAGWLSSISQKDTCVDFFSSLAYDSKSIQTGIVTVLRT